MRLFTDHLRSSPYNTDQIYPVCRRPPHGAAGSIRLGAPEAVLRNHMPVVLRRLKGRFPKIKVNLREGAQPQFEKWLQDREIDLAMTMLESKPPPGHGTSTRR